LTISLFTLDFLISYSLLGLGVALHRHLGTSSLLHSTHHPHHHRLSTITMPGKTSAPNTPRITKFTNCRLVRGSSLVEQDLWIDSLTGKILKDQEAFYELHLSPDEIIDLGGRILAPGLIDTQLNGAQGFDFSVPCATKDEYDQGLRLVNQGLARTGVTSYLPTVVSSTPEVYWKVKPISQPLNSI
jgi:N-acetylglucosamine-6-phosphate deacetylase